MSYEFKGIVKELSGVETKGSFSFTTLVLTKTITKRDGDTFDQDIAIQFSGQNIDRTYGLRKGDEVTVSFDIRSKEYNRKWYTNLNGFSVKATGAPEPMPAQPAQQPTAPAPSPMMDDDDSTLPF